MPEKNKTCKTCGKPSKNNYCPRTKIAPNKWLDSECEKIGKAKTAARRYWEIKEGKYAAGERGRYYPERLKNQSKKRICLKCESTFMSKHSGNRVCDVCNNQNTREVHNTYTLAGFNCDKMRGV